MLRVYLDKSPTAATTMRREQRAVAAQVLNNKKKRKDSADESFSFSSFNGKSYAKEDSHEWING